MTLCCIPLFTVSCLGSESQPGHRTLENLRGLDMNNNTENKKIKIFCLIFYLIFALLQNTGTFSHFMLLQAFQRKQSQRGTSLVELFAAHRHDMRSKQSRVDIVLLKMAISQNVAPTILNTHFNQMITSQEIRT